MRCYKILRNVFRLYTYLASITITLGYVKSIATVNRNDQILSFLFLKTPTHFDSKVKIYLNAKDDDLSVDRMIKECKDFVDKFGYPDDYFDQTEYVNKFYEKKEEESDEYEYDYDYDETYDDDVDESGNESEDSNDEARPEEPEYDPESITERDGRNGPSAYSQGKAQNLAPRGKTSNPITIRVSFNTDIGDLQTKAKLARKHLENRKTVIFTLNMNYFNSNKQETPPIFDKLLNLLKDIASPAGPHSVSGNVATITFKNKRPKSGRDSRAPPVLATGQDSSRVTESKVHPEERSDEGYAVS